METSLFIAKLIGPMLLVIGAALLINRDHMREMATDFLEHRGLIFLAGVLTLFGGLAIVLTHNVWEAGWPVVITILGWLLVVGGAFRILFPDSVKSIGQSMLDKPGLLTATGVVEGLIGAWLCYVSYIA
jgi:cytochrome bd-type quinol oxidase subunit 2